ncbi:MAG: hypothetical protein ABJF23_34250 [Bryobacteraceae bacterium]
MLLYPERDQRRGQVMANGGQAVDACMTGGTEGNQRFRGVFSRTAVMHMNPPGIEVRGSATLAAAAVAEKNRLAIPTEPAPGIPQTYLTDPAQIGAGCFDAATRAEETALGSHSRLVRKVARKRQHVCKRLFNTVAPIPGFDNTHYR